MRIIDSSAPMMSCYTPAGFDLARWEMYADQTLPGIRSLCENDMQDCLKAGFLWEKDFLPVLDAVADDPEGRTAAVNAFRKVTDRLEHTLMRVFGKTVDTDIVLYLGLCNGAGWVTEVNGHTVILLGIEKIMELRWHSETHMNALVLHELGHVFHAQYGSCHQRPDVLPDQLLWQLYTEGVAMVFEQMVLGDANYFHQDRDGWKAWCEDHLSQIAHAFSEDLPGMTHENQRYFGDWVRFDGHGDTGYYLSARFVRFMMSQESFDHVIGYPIDTVRKQFESFLQNV